MESIERIASQIIASEYDGDNSLYPTCVKCILHDGIFQALDESGMLKHAVFHGGTCVQKVYGGQRLSEDIDFNFHGNDVRKFFETGKIFSEIVKQTLINKYGLSSSDIEIASPQSNELHKKSTSKWIVKIIVGAKSVNYAPKSKIKIEIASTPAVNPIKRYVYPFKNIMSFKPILANVASLEEMFVDKATALIGRTYLKYRDVYDIQYFFDNNVRFDYELFLRKLASHLPTIPEYIEACKIRKQILYDRDSSKDFENEISRFIGVKKINEWKDNGLIKRAMDSSSELIDKLEDNLVRFQSVAESDDYESQQSESSNSNLY